MRTRLSTNELTNTINGDRYFQQISHHFEIGWPIIASTSRKNLLAPEEKVNRCSKHYVIKGIKLKKKLRCFSFNIISLNYYSSCHPSCETIPFVPLYAFKNQKL